MTIEAASRTALGELIDLLQEVEARWSGREWNLNSPEDIVSSHRVLMLVITACETFNLGGELTSMDLIIGC